VDNLDEYFDDDFHPMLNGMALAHSCAWDAYQDLLHALTVVGDFEVDAELSSPWPERFMFVKAALRQWEWKFQENYDQAFRQVKERVQDV
jgi:hypothetical protein